MQHIIRMKLTYVIDMLQGIISNANKIEIHPNPTKFYLLYRTTCLDRFRVISGSHFVFKTYSGRDTNPFSFLIMFKTAIINLRIT
jgi:hypothetical protein